MNKNIALFGGQGSQFVGMGKDIMQLDTTKHIFDIGAKICGIDLKELCLNSTLEELSKTTNAQICIFALSLAKFYQHTTIKFDGVAGFSLGEVSALVASGILSLEDGFKLVQKRGEVMQEASDKIEGEMYAVLGLDAPTVIDICAKYSKVYPVNFNTQKQIVISGEAQNLKPALEALQSAGARRLLKLPVSGPFHTPYMQEAGEKLAHFAKTLTQNSPALDFYTNIDGSQLQAFDLPTHLLKHMTSPVQFVAEIQTIVQNGYTSYIEFGAKPTLVSFIKTIDPSLTPID